MILSLGKILSTHIHTHIHIGMIFHDTLPGKNMRHTYPSDFVLRKSSVITIVKPKAIIPALGVCNMSTIQHKDSSALYHII